MPMPGGISAIEMIGEGWDRRDTCMCLPRMRCVPQQNRLGLIMLGASPRFGEEEY